MCIDVYVHWGVMAALISLVPLFLLGVHGDFMPGTLAFTKCRKLAHAVRRLSSPGSVHSVRIRAII